MRVDGVYISKISQPIFGGIVARPRVFDQLDSCRRSEIAWVSGPAGSGKTALVASYIEARGLPCVWYRMDSGDADPATFFYCLGQAFQRFLPPGFGPLPVLSSEYLQGLDTFAIRFFEQLLALEHAPKLIVVDNYHELPPDAEIHLILSKIFAKLPAGFSFVIISRELPHPKYARLRANNLLAVFQPDTLKLSIDEAQSVIATLVPELPAELTVLFHRHTMGWAAGLTLMAEHYRLTGESGTARAVRTPQGILDYFASELFEQIATVYQDFLLKTSAFNELTAQMARELTGLENSDEVLSTLNRKHLFTVVYPDGDPVFLHHPLFLEFLRSKAVSRFGQAGFRNLRCEAAIIAEQHGLRDEAADLYLACENWKGLAGLLEKMAVDIIAQGRTRQLIDWLGKVPPAEPDLHPRLHYWLGIAELSLAHSFKARAGFEKALTLSDGQHDGEGVYLAWSAIIESYFLEMKDWHPLDHWIKAFVELHRRYPDIPPGETEFRVALSGFTARVLGKSSQAEVKVWREHLDALLPHVGLLMRQQAVLIKSIHCVWSGDYHQNRLLLDQLREEIRGAHAPPPLPVLTLRLLDAMHYWLTVEPQNCRSAAKEGLELARSSGVSVWNHHFMVCLVEIALIEGNDSEARGYLRAMGQDLAAANNVDRFYYHLLSALFDFRRNDTASALSHLEVCHGPTKAIGSPVYEGIWCLAMAQVKLKRKAYDKARRFVERALAISQFVGSKNIEFLALLYQAQFLLEVGCPEEALVSLRSGMAIGRDQNYLHYIWWVPSVIADLCVVALRNGVETAYVRNLIARRGLYPAVPPVDVEQWPWEVTIHCLGKFEVLVHGAPVKIQKKPLELLKSIIALGGSGVRYERITDLLWPDAEGDTGLGNFKITLHRLRQLLGENSLQFKDGKLSLDTRRVWLDVWAFETLALKASMEWCKVGNPAVSLELTERALALYNGQFIKEDQEHNGVYLLREKLSRTFITLISVMGSRYMATSMFEQAIAIYQRGVEMEPLAEVLYEGLIRAYSESGYRVAAVQAYRRYETALRKTLDIAPTRRLTQLIQQL